MVYDEYDIGRYRQEVRGHSGYVFLYSEKQVNAWVLHEQAPAPVKH